MPASGFVNISKSAKGRTYDDKKKRLDELFFLIELCLLEKFIKFVVGDSSLEIAFVFYYQQTSTKGERQCRVPSKTERGKKTCKSLGGIYKTENDSNGTIYVLP